MKKTPQHQVHQEYVMNRPPASSTSETGLLLSDLFLKCKGSFTQSDFKDSIIGSENWKKAFRRSDFKVPFL